MNILPLPRVAIMIVLVSTLAGCGTPREKTAPCKRPVNLMSYAADTRLPECGPVAAINADPAAALAAVDAIAASSFPE